MNSHGGAEGGSGGPVVTAPNDSVVATMSVDALIERFGGIRPMAAKLDVPVTTVQGWKERAAIPERRWGEIAAAAARHGIALSSVTEGAPIDTPAEPSGGIGVNATDPPPPSRDRPAPRSRRALWIAGVIVAAIIAVLSARPALKDRWDSLFARRATPPEMTSTDASGTSVAEPKEEAPRQSSPSPPAASAESEAALLERIAALESRLSAADNTAIGALKSENRRLNEEVEQLRARLAVMEQDRAARREERERAQALVMGLGQLRAALAGPTPYGAQLELIESTMGKDAKVASILASLRPYADKGAPTRAMLAQQLEAITGDIIHASRPKGDTWRDRVAQQLASLVTVRRIGANAPEGGTEANLAHAESALAAGDLATAVTMVERLSGSSLDAAEPWLADARARLAADRALLALEARTFAILMSADGGKAP